MPVNLSKGGNVSLTKEAPGLKKILVGLGWDARATDGAEFDLDTSVFMLTEGDKVRKNEDFIFYNNLKSTDGSVEHLGDNSTGEGDGDDEQVTVGLDMVTPDIQKLAFAVTIHEAAERRQNFGMVSNAYMRVVNADTNVEIARYDLSEDAATEAAMVFGEIYRHNGEWKFRAVGQGFNGGLGDLAGHYGIS